MCHASHSKASSSFGFGKDFHLQKTKKNGKGGCGETTEPFEKILSQMAPKINHSLSLGKKKKIKGNFASSFRRTPICSPRLLKLSLQANTP